MAASPIPLRRDPAVAPSEPAGREWSEVDDLSGAVLERRYRLIRQLGVGGMGTVYLAEHALLGTQCAIKVLGPRYAFDREWVQRFFLEARAALMIPHENIVRIHDFAYPEPGRVYMVMELVDGESLADLVEREGALPWRRALEYADQIAAALEAAHARGIVHRDIKPSNCLRCAETDRIKVLDFGIAKFLDPGRAGLAVPRTSTDVWMGTAEFMAPELFHGERADERVDVYALGALMFKLLTGRTPYIGTHLEVATQMLTQLPPAASAVGPTERPIPPAVDRLIAGTLAHAPGERTPTMTSLREQIAAALLDEEALEPTVLYPLSPTLLAPAAEPGRARGATAANVIRTPARRGRGRRSGGLGVALAALGAGLVLAGGAAWSASRERVVMEVGPVIVSPPPEDVAWRWERPVIPDRVAPPVRVVEVVPEIEASRSRVRPEVRGAATKRESSGEVAGPTVRPPPPPPRPPRAAMLTATVLRRELAELRPALSRCFAGHGVARGTRLIGEVIVDRAGHGSVSFSGGEMPGLASCIRSWVRDHMFPVSEQGGKLQYSFFAE
jgi:serine/threonine-protein kinase